MRTPLAAVVAVGLALAGSGLLLISSAYGGSPQTDVLGGNFPVNQGAGNPADISAHNSPTIVRNPADETNIVVTDRIDSPAFSCAMHVSTDAGASFRQIALPRPAGEPPKCYAPDAAFDSEGTLYVSFLTLKGLANVPHAAWIATSDDGGTTLSEPVRVLGPLSFQVRLTAHPHEPERLYLSWLDAEDTATLAFPDGGYPIMFKASDDGGRTWGTPRRVSDAARLRVVAPSPAVAPDKTVYIAFLDLKEDRLDYHGGHGGFGGEPYPGTWELVLARSLDEGQSWEEVVVEDELTPTERFIVFLPQFPAVAAGPDGSVYVAFHDGRLGDADVWLWRSPDRGSSWFDPVRVNDTRRRDRTSQYLPRVALAPDERIDVVYYDRRNDSANVMNEVSLSSSYDGGATFAPSVRISDRPFSSKIGWGNERDMTELGGRLGLLATEARSLAVWTDTRNGTEASAKQDIMRAVVEFSNPPDLPSALDIGLRAGGWLMVAAGLAWLVAWGAAGRFPGARGRAEVSR